MGKGYELVNVNFNLSKKVGDMKIKKSVNQSSFTMFLGFKGKLKKRNRSFLKCNY